MSAFLLLLVKVNLAMGAAIVLMSLLRRPLRAQFGASIAYAAWLLVPMAGIASLFPPRAAAPVPAPIMPVPVALISVTGHVAHSALRVTEKLTGQIPLAVSLPPSASAYAMPDTVVLLFVAWVLGMLLVAVHLTRLQLRFHAAVRLREAGPAVLGFLRPSIVTPDGFHERFTPQEWAAILAHEQVHLERQDARINALAALLRCLCWFNPLIHLGTRWMRIDQELACDATTVAGAVSRRDYANALLKSQIMTTALPLGCNWPGSQHPLIERIALLKRKPPGNARRLVGMGLVMLATASAGLGAWAAQPPVAAQVLAIPPATKVLSRLPRIVVAPRQIGGDAGANQSVANATATGIDPGLHSSKNVRANEPVSTALATVTPKTVSIDDWAQSVVAALPPIDSVPEPKITADQYPTSQDTTLTPKETLAKNSVTAPAKGDDPPASAASNPPPKLICVRGQADTGTHFRASKECHTESEWANISDQARRMMENNDQRVKCPSTGVFACH